MSQENVKEKFMETFMEAKRLEKEAFMMLIPERVKEHLDVIKNEATAMFGECLVEILAQRKSSKQEAKEGTQKGKVTKVTIN